MASVPVAELPPYTRKNGASSIGFSPGSGSPIVMYRLCPIVVIPTPNVAVSWDLCKMAITNQSVLSESSVFLRALDDG
jgi:hypothetical protein